MTLLLLWFYLAMPRHVQAAHHGRVQLYKNKELIATCASVTDGWVLSGCAVEPGHDLDEVLSVLVYELKQEREAAQSEPDCSATRTRYRVVRM